MKTRNAKYIKIEAVEKLAQSKASRAIREDYSLRELAFNPSGYRKLLSQGSYKFDKKDGKPIITKGMYLSPSNEAGYGINTCANATKECRAGCLIFTGQMKMKPAINSRIMKTRFFYAYPEQFLDSLIDELFEAVKQASWDREIIQFRLNGTSDINWEKYLHLETLIKDIPACEIFYDYTKNPNRQVNRNHYHLTYSISDNSKSLSHGLDYLEKGQSVAVVTSKTEMKQLLEVGSKTFINGDKNDHRPQDPKSSIVLLSFKGKGATKAQRGTSKGFVKSAEYIIELLTKSSGLIQKAKDKVK